MGTSVQRVEAMPHKPGCKCPPCRYRRGEGKGAVVMFTVRLKTEVADWLRSRPDGARAYLEALVTDAMAREEPDGPAESQ